MVSRKIKTRQTSQPAQSGQGSRSNRMNSQISLHLTHSVFIFLTNSPFLRTGRVYDYMVGSVQSNALSVAADLPARAWRISPTAKRIRSCIKRLESSLSDLPYGGMFAHQRHLDVNDWKSRLRPPEKTEIHARLHRDGRILNSTSGSK